MLSTSPDTYALNVRSQSLAVLSLATFLTGCQSNPPPADTAALNVTLSPQLRLLDENPLLHEQKQKVLEAIITDKKLLSSMHGKILEIRQNLNRLPFLSALLAEVEGNIALAAQRLIEQDAQLRSCNAIQLVELIGTNIDDDLKVDQYLDHFISQLTPGKTQKQQLQVLQQEVRGADNSKETQQMIARFAPNFIRDNMKYKMIFLSF